MAKMIDRNKQLKSALGTMAPKQRVVESLNIPKEDTRNIEGRPAYSLSDEFKLVTMLNTLKVQPQFYRTEGEQMKELQTVLERVALKDPYFAAQAIVWSRCLGEGMRSINHLAATLLAPYIAGQEYAKRFYGLFNKKEKSGGCVFRPDDMSEMKDVWAALNTVTVEGREKMKALPNAMKKGFASALESMDTYQLAKYSKSIIDLTNLVHPKSSLSKAEIEIEVDGKKVKMKTLDALMKGYTVTADTWEAAQSEAGQMVAKAVKEGKMTKTEAEKVLAEAKADNWETLLKDGKLGVLAALRNIRNIMKNPRKETIEMWCRLIKDPEKIRKALILPVHFDLAYDIVVGEFGNIDYTQQVQKALLEAYEASIPNLAAALPGKTLVIVDRSGSMDCSVIPENYKPGTGYRRTSRHTDTCAYKAGLIAATICKATGADVVKFGSTAERFNYNKHTNVFALAKAIGTASCDSTNPAAAFDLIARERAAYDRIIFISDNAVNSYNLVSTSYRKYIHDVCSPYIYAVDLAAYGTTPLKNEGKVSYLFGYGSTLFDAIASGEFNAEAHMDEIRKINI